MNDKPQPQEAVALGFIITKDSPIISILKSIVEPLIISRETLSITDRSYLLFDGQILKSGTSESLANDEEARRLYLGEKFRLD